MMSLSASEIKKGSLFRQHQLDVQNALKCFGITSSVEWKILRYVGETERVTGCKQHERLEFEEYSDFLIHAKPSCEAYDKFYLLDNYVPSLNLDIESDGRAHSPKGQRARDEKRDAYLESLGITVLRFTTKQDPVMIAKAVSLMKRRNVP